MLFVNYWQKINCYCFLWILTGVFCHVCRVKNCESFFVTFLIVGRRHGIRSRRSFLFFYIRGTWPYCCKVLVVGPSSKADTGRMGWSSSFVARPLTANGLRKSFVGRTIVIRELPEEKFLLFLRTSFGTFFFFFVDYIVRQSACKRPFNSRPARWIYLIYYDTDKSRFTTQYRGLGPQEVIWSCNLDNDKRIMRNISLTNKFVILAGRRFEILVFSNRDDRRKCRIIRWRVYIIKMILYFN